MFLRDFRTRIEGLPDLLAYAYLSAEGVMVLKDGSYVTAWLIAGPDLNAHSHTELAVLSAQINRALATFGDGYMIHCDAMRRSVTDYRSGGAFPDPLTRAIESEHAAQFQAAGEHYETFTTLTLTYRPPSPVERTLSRWFVEGEESAPEREQHLKHFQQTAHAFAEVISARLSVVALDSAMLLTYLNSCITGLRHPVRVPDIPCYLDAILGTQDFYAGFQLQIGRLHCCPIGVTGFPLESSPEILSFLTELPAEFRWSNRFLFLDPETAQRHLKRYRRKWSDKSLRAKDLMSGAFTGEVTQTWRNQDAVSLAEDANQAAAEASGNLVRFGFYTCVIVVFHEDRAVLDAIAEEVVKELRQHGFGARIEEANAIEAYLGSLPGHGWPNVRRPICHSLNVADFLPLTSVWTGLEHNPSPYFAPNSPPIFWASTSGTTPFRFHLHAYQDVGHTLLLGPTGQGKSTLIGFLIAQFFRYAEAQVFLFDLGYSAYVLTKASGGTHYAIAGEETAPGFCPLAHIDDPHERMWAAEYVEQLLNLQGVMLTPEQRKAVYHALELLSESPSRTLTDLVNTLQDHALRDGLHHYTLAGSLGALLDAEQDSVALSALNVFEMSHILDLGEKNFLPVFLYLVHRVEQRLDGRPTLIIFEESGISALKSQAFGDTAEDWLRTLRKKNAAVVLATQSLADVCQAEKRDMLLTSCPTKIFLPNPEARGEHSAALYHSLGLTERETERLATALPKRDYYFTSPLGSRMIDLELGPLALSFIGASGHDNSRTLMHEVSELERSFRESWPAEWLRRRGLHAEADLFVSCVTEKR